MSENKIIYTGSNRRIAKNTIYLYFRMLLVLGVTLFTSREILNILGVVDYGIYNVVGGVVSMFTFLNSTLSTSSQRYFSIALVKGDLSALHRLFNSNLIVFSILAIGCVLVLETIGLWFLNNEMTIPRDRIFAANVVYQFSVLAFLLNMLSIPYNALIIAYEKMNIFSYIGILEAVLKLAVVGALYLISRDSLIIYGLLTFCISIIILILYVSYCLKKIRVSHLSWYWNKNMVRELMSFSGWHFMGTISAVFRSYGVNILLNLFFNPAINAARAISFQVSNASVQLSNNFFTAVKPQIYKLYSSNHYSELYRLIFRSTIFSVFLVSIIALPIILNVHYILNLWLKQVPLHSDLFTQLVLVEAMILGANGSTIAPALATGKIRNFELVTSGTNLLIFPVCYIILSFGASPESTVIVSITLSSVTVIFQSYMLKRMLHFPFFSYVILLLKMAVVTFGSWGILSYMFVNEGFTALFMDVFGTIILLSLFYYVIIVSAEDRHLINAYAVRLIFKIRHLF